MTNISSNHQNIFNIFPMTKSPLVHYPSLVGGAPPPPPQTKGVTISRPLWGEGGHLTPSNKQLVTNKYREFTFYSSSGTSNNWQGECS